MQRAVLLAALIGGNVFAAEDEPVFGSYSNGGEGFKTTSLMLLPRGRGEISAGGTVYEITWKKTKQPQQLSIAVPSKPKEGELSVRFEIDPPRLLFLNARGDSEDILERLEDQSYFHLTEQVTKLGDLAKKYGANQKSNGGSDSLPEDRPWFLVLNTTKNQIHSIDLGDGKKARIVCEIADTLNFSIQGDFKILEFGHTWISRPDARNSRLEALGEQPPKNTGEVVRIFSPIFAGEPLDFSIGSWTATIPFVIDGREFEYKATFLIRLQELDERIMGEHWLNGQVSSHLPTYTVPKFKNQKFEQDDAGEPDTRSESGKKFQLKSEGHSR